MNIKVLNRFEKYLKSLNKSSLFGKKKTSNPDPKDKALYNRIKNKIKRTAKVWPSRWASWHLTKEYTRKGGRY